MVRVLNLRSFVLFSCLLSFVLHIMIISLGSPAAPDPRGSFFLPAESPALDIIRRLRYNKTICI